MLIRFTNLTKSRIHFQLSVTRFVNVNVSFHIRFSLSSDVRILISNICIYFPSTETVEILRRWTAMYLPLFERPRIVFHQISKYIKPFKQKFMTSLLKTIAMNEIDSKQFHWYAKSYESYCNALKSIIVQNVIKMNAFHGICWLTWIYSRKLWKLTVN